MSGLWPAYSATGLAWSRSAFVLFEVLSGRRRSSVRGRCQMEGPAEMKTSAFLTAPHVAYVTEQPNLLERWLLRREPRERIAYRWPCPNGETEWRWELGGGRVSRAVAKVLDGLRFVPPRPARLRSVPLYDDPTAN